MRVVLVGSVVCFFRNVFSFLLSFVSMGGKVLPSVLKDV